MKSMNQFFKKAVIVPLLCISTVCFTQSSVQSIVNNDNSNSSNVEFVKSDGNMLVFDVSLSGLPEKGCMLKITNEAGEFIFETKISASSYKKTYRIERNEMSKLNFEAVGKNFRFNETFNLRFIVEEKLEVTKL